MRGRCTTSTATLIPPLDYGLGDPETLKCLQDQEAKDCPGNGTCQKEVLQGEQRDSPVHERRGDNKRTECCPDRPGPDRFQQHDPVSRPQPVCESDDQAPPDA